MKPEHERILQAISRVDIAMQQLQLSLTDLEDYVKKAPRERRKETAAGIDKGGRPSWREMAPAVAHKARELRAGGMSLNQTSLELAKLGFKSKTGRPFTRSVVSRMARE